METLLVRCINEALSKGHIRKVFPAGHKEGVLPARNVLGTLLAQRIRRPLWKTHERQGFS